MNCSSLFHRGFKREDDDLIEGSTELKINEVQDFEVGYVLGVSLVVSIQDVGSPQFRFRAQQVVGVEGNGSELCVVCQSLACFCFQRSGADWIVQRISAI